MKPFQIIFISVFIIIAIAGVLTFALTGSKNAVTTQKATVWGTVSDSDFQQLVSNINSQGQVIDVTYQRHDAAKIDSDFVNALAEGGGPDIIIYPDDKFLRYKAKLYQIPYSNFPERTYIDTFVDSSNIFLGKDGVWAVPFMVDPLITYWNKATFNAAGIANPPKKWSDLDALAPKIIKKNAVGGISNALVAMGEYRNVNNAEDLLSTLIFQNHNPISTPSDLDRDQVNFVVDEQTNNFGDSIAALSFYTSFSNPDMPNYTWNRSFSNSNDAFSGGNLAIYFGKASEINVIRNKNPNLYFDVAPILASDDVNVGNKTKATVYVMSLVKNSKNLAGGFAALNYLTNSDSQKLWATLSGLPPARRDLLSAAPNDPFQSVFYASAIRSETWLNPDPDQASLAFQDMIESVSTGKQKANEVITPFASRLRNMYLAK
ncbi:MAG: extracellular solute-binding protein [bacterium]